jgi:tetratricopeptide (TPR) repeat protein
MDQSNMNEVQAYESSITLPTYAIKGQNRNPVFRSQYGVAHIYPYTLLDDIASTSQDQTYHTLILENQYLRVTIITDLGGRVYSVFDKLSQREVFYKNPVVRFAPLAIRGAFFSGGVEFSFPVAHAPTTADKVNWDLRHHEDGSASASIGGLEHLSGLRWMITLTLFPDRCALAQDVYLFNPSTLPGRYHYWTNASLDANEGTEFIYPFRRVRSYEYAGSASWPFARLDLIQEDPGLPGMEGVPMWPARNLQEPISFRWQKNMLAQVSIFGRNVAWDYFGAWQHNINHGYAHIARSQDVAGMKLWSWGNAPVGIVNQTSLTDDGSQYAETQCGAMETQLDFDFLQPGQTRTWREWWLPLRGIGGLTCASETLGARISLVAGESSESIKLIVALCPAKPYDDALVNVTLPEKILIEKTCSFSPEKPWILEKTVPAIEIADKPITLTVVDSSGNTILENMQDREPDLLDDFEKKEETSPATADDFYLQGLGQEKFDNREQAKEAYRKALQFTENHPEANFRLGLLLLKSAVFKEADRHLSHAEEAGLIEASYYRGVIALLEGRLNQARTHFTSAQNSVSHSIAALMGLGKLALHEKNWDQAIRFFELAGQQAGGSIAPTILLAIALRQAGKQEKAHAELQRALARDPLNHPALYEIASGKYPESPNIREKLQRVLSDDDQYIIDLACYYMNAGLQSDALNVLEMAWRDKETAMAAYLGAFLAHQIGDTSAEGAWFAKAQAASPDFGFPSRLEEVLVLQFALEKDPQDCKAKYFLGNFFYAHERYNEAVQLWTEALERMETYDVLLRNLGLAAWQRKNNPNEAIQWFEKALAFNARNQDLYLHLDELYKSLGLPDQRMRLLEKINSLSDIREDVRKHRLKMMVELGQYETALEIMTSERFIPLEMDQSFHEVYVQALMLRAKAHLEAGQTEEAIHDYNKMLEYPENHGVGAPISRAQAHIYYHLGVAYEKSGRYRQAIKAWREAAREHHSHGNELFAYVQWSLDKLSRYSELGLEE